MDDRPTSYAILHTYGRGAQVIVRCRGAKLDKDFLCKGGKLEAYVTTPEIVHGESPTVRVRFDGSQPVRQTWGRSEDYKALFAPNPRALVAQLLKSKEFLIEYPPYEKTPETLQFDVSGLRQAPYAAAMNSFLRNLTREQITKACGAGIANESSVRVNLQFPPSNETRIGLDFEFSTYGNDAGRLLSIQPLGIAEKDKYKLTWYGGSVGGASDDETAFRLVSSSQGLMDQWKASQQSASGNK